MRSVRPGSGLPVGLRWPVVAMLALGVAGGGCSGVGESTEPAADPAAASSSPRPGTSLVSGVAPPASGVVASVVTLESSDEGGPPPTGPAIMDQFGMTFLPNLLVARRGQPVEFRNSDDVAHNVLVFDLEGGAVAINVMTPIGGAYTFTPEQAASYGVRCDIHPAMGAVLVIVESPHFAIADRDGSFDLGEVPHGAYTARVWSLEAALRSERPVVVEGPRTELRLRDDA